MVWSRNLHFSLSFIDIFFSNPKQGHQPGKYLINTSNNCNIKSINYQPNHNFIIRLYNMLVSIQWLMFFTLRNTCCQKFLYTIHHSESEMYVDLVLQNNATSYWFSQLISYTFYFSLYPIISINILQTCLSSKNSFFCLLKRYIMSYISYLHCIAG